MDTYIFKWLLASSCFSLLIVEIRIYNYNRILFKLFADIDVSFNNTIQMYDHY